MDDKKSIENDGILNVIEDGSLNKKEVGNKDTDEVKSDKCC